MSSAPRDKPAAPKGLLQTVTDRISARVTEATKAASRVYRSAAPVIQTATDYAWFIGSSALLLSLPILVEIQRETTVMVLQRQREQEIAQMQEQARALNASTIDNLKATMSMLTGGGPAPPGGAPQQ